MIEDLTYQQKIIVTLLLTAVLGFWTLASFFVSFSWLIYILIWILAGFCIKHWPPSGILASIFLTFSFERQFALQPLIIGEQIIKIYPLDILLLLTAFLVFYRFFKQKDSLQFNWGLLEKSIFGFILLSVIYYLLSLTQPNTDWALAGSTLKNYAFYSLFYFLIVWGFNQKEDFQMLLKTFLLGGLAIIPFIFWGLFSGQGLWTEFMPLSTLGRRLLAPTQAFYLIFPLVFLLAGDDFLALSKKLARTRLVLAWLWIGGILVSLARHLWIVLAGQVLMLFLFFPDARENMRVIFKKPVFIMILLIFVWLLGVLFFGSLAPYQPPLTDWFQGLAVRVESLFRGGDVSFAWRQNLWHEAWQQFLKSPVLGIGFGKTITFALGGYHFTTEVRNLHNSLFVLLLQMGILGFLVFLFLNYQVFRLAQKKLEKTLPLLVIYLGFLGAAFFGTYFEINLLVIFYWIILGMLRIKVFQSYSEH